MLKILSKALGELSASQADQTNNEHSLRVAMAALLVHASAADGDISVEESDKIRALLTDRFSLKKDESSLLMEIGEDETHNAVDLYSFTKTLTDQLDQPGRQQFVKMMWEVILADDQVDDFEAHLIWRVADLLGVSTRDRVSLRKQVEEGL